MRDLDRYSINIVPSLQFISNGSPDDGCLAGLSYQSGLSPADIRYREILFRANRGETHGVYPVTDRGVYPTVLENQLGTSLHLPPSRNVWHRVS
ncbi:hypothetical protein Zmor_018894 [Zophobas morio]|uniref:Uncharacterized protein n=1 Tax=Zophobas morio TaxID=2755281 RepID=A0AA38MDV8_9CUCU|nr:hypothetical protein Zmor_018894 [Zophobas morio]